MNRARYHPNCRQAIALGLAATLYIGPQTNPARADTTPPPGATDPRIRTLIYTPDDVIRLAGQVGYAIDLEFAPDEHFVGMAAGDMEGITFETAANHLFLKPKAPRISTNLTILTDRRSYHLDYRATTRRTQAPDAAPIYALRFLYPEDEARAAAAVSERRREAAALASALATPNPPLNLDYAYCGPRSLRPDAALDDGLQTRLSFRSHTELPAVFLRNDDGSESLLNFTVAADGLILHRVARQFILRRGREVGCIVNRAFQVHAFQESADRRSNGTVTPLVRRSTATVQ